MAGAATANGVATTCIKLPALGTGIYSITVMTDAQTFDALSAFLYVGTENQILVTADVEPSMGFYLYADTCNLGVLNASVPSTCSYNASTTSNTAAVNGNLITVTVKANTSADLNFPSGPTPITGAANCAAFSAGKNGIRLSATSTSDWAPPATFSCPVNQGAGLTTSFQTLLTSASGWSNGEGTFTVQHIAQASSGTLSGHYTQLVTYMVTSQF